MNAQKPKYYRGLPEIASRLNVRIGTIPQLQQDFALPMYRDLSDAHGPTWTWTIDEPSIVAWQRWRARCDRAYDSLRAAIRQPGIHGTASAHAKRHYVETMKRYRRLLLEQTSAPLTKDDVDLALTMFHVKHSE